MEKRALDAWSRRRFLAAAGGTGTAALTLAACGSGSAAGPVIQVPKVSAELIAAAKPYRGGTLTMLSQQEYAQSANQALDTALQTFAKATGTTIRNSLISPDAGNAVSKVDASVKAGNAPDLAFFSAARFVAQLRSLGDLVDVSDVVAELQGKWGAAAYAAKTAAQIDGKWWGVPYYTIGQGWFARRDWLAEKGISLSELTTYQKVRDIALEISDPAKNRYGWGISVNRSGDGNAFIENVINVYGGAICSDDGRKVVFDSPQTVEAVAFIADLYSNPRYKHMLPPGIQSWTDNSNNENWLAGVTGFTRNQLSLYASAKTTKNPVYANTAVFSGVGGPATAAPCEAFDCQALMIFKGSRNAGLAKVLAQYLVAGSPLLSMAKVSDGLVLPAYAKIWESNPFYTSGDRVFPAVRENLAQKWPVVTSTGYHYPQLPSPGRQSADQSYVLTDMMGEILQNGTSVQKAVSDTHKRIAGIFQQAGYPQ
jgi:multiple sugar transport system substrate-binding protein